MNISYANLARNQSDKLQGSCYVISFEFFGAALPSVDVAVARRKRWVREYYLYIVFSDFL